MERLLTTAEVAEMTRTPINTLRYWRHQGLGPKSAKLGRRVLYRESDIERWIETRFNMAVAEKPVVLPTTGRPPTPGGAT